MKDLIFISHASPDDNYKASWLASKLKILGYRVWVDVQDLRTGDSFWPEIERKIRKETVRFIMIVTNHYNEKASTPRSGVRKEIACADTIRDIERLIYPVKFDDCDYGDFPIDILELNANNFFDNWGVGLKKLLKEFDDDKIIRNEQDLNPLSLWYESQKIENSFLKREERYFSNWFRLNIPKNISLHFPKEFKNDFLNELPFTFIRYENAILTFHDGNTYEDKFLDSFDLQTEDFFQETDLRLNDQITIKEPPKKIVSLLNKALKSYYIKLGLHKYQLSGKREAYFFPYNELNKKQISLKHLGRTRKALVGNQLGVYWHYGISHKVDLLPFPHYKIYHHLFFSDLEKKLVDKRSQIIYRRSIPSDWYNRDWLDLLLACFTKLCGDEYGVIKLYEVVGRDITISPLPELYNSNIGYNEVDE